MSAENTGLSYAAKFTMGALLCASALFGAATAAEFRGITADGARFLLKTPDGWRSGDTLVIVNHGFQFEPETGDPSLGPEALRDLMLSRGYALAASGYSTTGWATFTAKQDTEQLMQAVLQKLGTPGRVLTSGGSLGGLISVQQAELAAAGQLPSLPRVDGILSLCPPLAGSRIWDKAIDFRVSYDQICAGVSGGELTSGPSSAPWLLDANDVDNGGSNTTLAKVALSASRCVGLEVPDLLQSDGMRARRSKLLAATQVRPEFIAQLLFYSTFALSDLVYSPKKLGGLNFQPFENRGVDYRESQLNLQVRRLASDPLARLNLMANYTPTGAIGGAKLLSIATSQDGLVIPEHLRALEGKVNPPQWVRALVTERTPSHCGFNDAELVQAFKSLDAWSQAPAAGTQAAVAPSVASLNSACADCRFSSAENLSSLDEALPARKFFQEQIATVNAGVNGDWYNPTRSGEGLKIEALPDGRALINFFTYPRAGESAAQLWLTGTGTIIDNGIVIEDAYRTFGARFGSAFRAADVRLERWGSMRFAMSECGKAKFSYVGPAGYGSGTVDLQQLTRQQVPCFSRQPQLGITGFSGSWYDPSRSGEGITLTLQNDRTVAMAWFTYTPTGDQAWFVMQGNFVDQDGGRSGIVQGALAKPVGTRFGTAFNPAQVNVESFGTAQLRFSNCRNAELSVQTPWGNQVLNLQRLTLPQGSEICPGL